jgi:uncharacterized membrane protein YdjX (TVP38/TMEM64 family)
MVSIEQARAWADELGRLPWWSPIVVVALYPVAAYVMFPRWLITMAGVFAFGAGKAFVYGELGMVLAAIATYLPGRLLARDTVRRLAGPRLARLNALLQRRGMLAVILVRLVPVAPFGVVNLVMGAMRIRVLDFIVGSAIGIVPGMLAATVLSGQLSSALTDPAGINGWLVVSACVVLVALAYGGQRWLRRMDRQQAAA